jgi:hypothetical protein
MSTFTTSLSRRSRIIPALGAALTAAAIAPGIASASTTWFGSSLNHDPANAGVTCADFGVGNVGDLCTHVASDFPGTSGRVKSPATGTIIALKLAPQGPMTFTAEVVNVRNLSSDLQSGQAQATAHSREITLAGPTQDQMDNGIYPVDTVLVHMKVKKGQEIAINTASNTAEYCSNGTPGQLLFDPILIPGAGFSNSAGVDDCLMLVQAVVKH